MDTKGNTFKDTSNMSPGDAVYGFAAWLTTRKEITKFGADCDSAIVAELVNKFCEANGLVVSHQYPDNFKFPKE